MLRLPRLIRFLLVATGAGVLVLGGLRLAFFLAFHNAADPVAAGDLAQAFYLGAKFDLRIVLVLLVPLAMLAGFRPLSPFEGPGRRLFWSGYVTLAALGLALFYALDFGHYAYLATRVDNTVLRFLENADISFAMVWESYPVVRIALGILTATAAIAYGVYRLFGQVAVQPAPVLRWRGRLAVGVVTFFVMLGGVYGKVSWYPLRWSDAYFSPHAFAAAVAVNPLHYFLDTRKNGGVSYSEDKVREYYDVMAGFLGVEAPDRAALRFERSVAGSAATRPNIVVVQLESFATYKTSFSGNPLDPTPHMARIARDGMYFPNFFVPHTGTARAVFATTTGTPDVELNGTSSRNPVIVNQHSVLAGLDGYEKFYFLGGSASWGNIRGVLSHNIPGLHIYEEGSYESPRVDVWGISDLSLFEEANQVLRGLDKPFVAYIQTSGGHRPYTIPDDNRGFESLSPGNEAVQKFGFDDEAEFNSFRFLDHAVGWFMDAARNEAYFANTIFVFFGDHGLGGNAGRHAGPAENQLELNAHRVPLVIYAPGRIAAQVDERVASQVDVLPTVAHLAGQPYRVRTLGRDLLDPRHDSQRYAFLINHGRREIGVLGDGYLLRTGIDGSQPRLFRLDGTDVRTDFSAREPERAARMHRLAVGMYETAKYMLHHNNRDAH